MQSIADALAAALRSAAVRERLASVGLTAQSRTPSEMAALITSDAAQYARLVREMDLKIE